MRSKIANFVVKAALTCGSIIGILVLCALFNTAREAIFPPTPTPTHVPPTPTPQRIRGSIHDFLAAHQIQVQLKGDDINTVEMLITKLVEDALEVEVPVGTLIIPADEDLQRMVVRNPKIIYLDTNIQLDVDLDVSCADYHKDVPRSIHTMAELQPPPQDELTRLLQTMAAADDLSYEYKFYSVAQAAVWIVTDDSSYSGLGRLVISSSAPYDYFHSTTTRAIDEDDAARAMFLVQRSGIDITSRRIWEDRAAIIAGLKDPSLGDWIRSLEG